MITLNEILFDYIYIQFIEILLNIFNFQVIDNEIKIQAQKPNGDQIVITLLFIIMQEILNITIYYLLEIRNQKYKRQV